MPRPRRPTFLDDDETYETAITYDGIPEATKKLTEWIKKFHSGPKSMENEGELEIELFHYVAGSMGGEDAFAIVEFDFALTPDQIAAQILEASTEYLDSTESGKVRFRAQADGVKGKCLYTLTVPERNTGDDPDEAPTTKGLVAQQMRHCQMLVKVNVSAIGQIANAHKEVNTIYQKLLEEKDKRIGTLETGYLGNIRQMEDLANMRHLRDLDIQKMHNDERNKERVAGVLMNGIPHVINKILTGGNGPRHPFVDEPRSPLENQIEALIETIDEEQFNAFVSSGVFKQEQLMVLIEIVQFMRARQAAERQKAAEQAAAQNGGPPGQGMAPASNGGQNGAPGGYGPGPQGPPQGPGQGPPPGWGPGPGQGQGG